jgi:hypothetical protein
MLGTSLFRHLSHHDLDFGVPTPPSSGKRTEAGRLIILKWLDQSQDCDYFCALDGIHGSE